MTLLELMQLLRKHLKLVVAMPVACAVVMALYSVLAMPNEYTATTSMYVLSNNASTDTANTSSYSDLSASQMITNDAATLLESSTVKDSTAKALKMNSLSGYDISVTSATTTRVLELSVTGQDAQSTAIIANELAKEVSEVAQSVMGIEAINVIDEAATPDVPSGPNRPLYIAVALLAGLFAAVALVVLMDMVDTRVRSGEDVEALLGVPVIGRIPQASLASPGSLGEGA